MSFWRMSHIALRIANHEGIWRKTSSWIVTLGNDINTKHCLGEHCMKYMQIVKELANIIFFFQFAVMNTTLLKIANSRSTLDKCN